MVERVVFYFAVPTIIIVVLTLFLFKKRNKISTDILGIVIGIILGFSANILQEGFLQLYEDRQTKIKYIKILKEEAINLFTMYIVWERATKAKNLFLPEATKKRIPEVDMPIWKRVKLSDDFLELTTEKPFDKIYSLFSYFETINSDIAKAKNGDHMADARIILVHRDEIYQSNKHYELIRVLLSYDEIKELYEKLNLSNQ